MKIKAGISIIWITVFLILMGAVSAVDATVVRVEPASQTVSAGEDFSVDVYVDTVTELTADGAILHFDPAAMRATAVTEGITSGYPKFFTCEEIDNTTGLVTFTYGLSPGSSVSGSGPLITIELTADSIAEGTYNLDLTDVGFYDEIGPIQVEGIYNGTVIITGGVTPTPTAGDGDGGTRRDALLRKTPTPTITPVPTPTPTEEEKTYENITSAGELTVEILDKKLTITFKKNVSGVKITAKEFVEKPADISDAPGIVFKYLEYNIENVSAEDIEKATIPFDVPKSWIASENIDPVTIKLNRYYGGVWSPLPTEKIGEDNDNIHYSAEAEGLSLFAITGEKKTEAPVTTPSSAMWIWGVVGVVLLIVVIAGVWYIKKKRK